MRFGYLAVCILFALCLSGCSVHMPVLSPNDENVLDLARAAVSDISKFTVQMKGHALYGMDNKGIFVSYTSAVSGYSSGLLYGIRTEECSDVKTKDSDFWKHPSSFEESDVKNDMQQNGIVLSDGILKNQVEWYLDTLSDTYYERQTDVDWAGYENGTSVISVDWWKSQLDNMTFRYDGDRKDANGKSCYVLSTVYTGQDLVALFQHFGFRWAVDAKNASMIATVYLDKWSGKPSQILFQLASDGSCLDIANQDGTYSLAVFEYGFQFHYDADDVVLPEDVTDVSLQQPLRDMLVSDAVSLDEKKGLVCDDFSVNVVDNDVFDVVHFDEKTQMIQISSSKDLEGQPMMSVSTVSSGDAYTDAVSAVSTVLDFYQNQGLTEIYVPSDVIQMLVADRPSYVYHTQYTDAAAGFVHTDYFVYITLNERSYVKVHVSSMVDQGVGVVLTDSYVKSMLSQIVVEGGDSDD